MLDLVGRPVVRKLRGMLFDEVLVDAVFRAERAHGRGEPLHDIGDLRLFETLRIFASKAERHEDVAGFGEHGRSR